MHLEMNGFGAPGLHNGRKEIVFYVYLCELLKVVVCTYVNIFSEIVVTLLSKTALPIDFNLHVQYFHPDTTIVFNSDCSFVTTKKGYIKK
jgi:hypothetical protein